ncbi:MAG: S8 family serine peptidase [Cyclobacteriaceae bacterium]
MWLRFFSILTLLSLADISVYSQSQRKFQLPTHLNEDDYEPFSIYLKLSDTPTAQERRLAQGNIFQLEALNEVISGASYNQAFKPRASANSRSKPRKFLKNVYKISLDPGVDLEESINQLLKFDNVLYAEPVYRFKPLLTPNDPQANPTSGNQSYLSTIKAYDAWDISTGSEEVIVAVIDTGADMDHPDLVNSFFVNEADPINGIDDDNDGLIDNFIGYDFANDDNDPEADQSGHGVRVAGLSSATTNNGEGIAGAGFNSKLMPLKGFLSGTGFSNNLYEAVLWASENGIRVQNLSWGSPGVSSQVLQDLINEAVITNNSVLVAAAGNTPEELNFFPASYDNVLSVTSSNVDDTFFNDATFSYHVDLMAPGANNYTTANGGGYENSGPGTSYAAPLVAGTAALLVAEFPEWTAQQIMEQIRITSDDVHEVGTNNGFFGQIGKGRLNMFRALTDTLLPSVRAQDINITNNFGDFAFYGDTLSMKASFQNFLYPTSNALAEIVIESEFATALNPQLNLDSLASLQKYDADSVEFKILLTDNAPPNERIFIQFNFTDGETYNDWQFTEFTTTPDFLDLGNTSIRMTTAGNGNLGYQSDVETNGIGLEVNEVMYADQLGIIITADGTLLDNSVNNFSEITRNGDFNTINSIKLFEHATAGFYAYSKYDDSNAIEPKSLIIEQKTIPTSDNKFLLVEYRISNASSDDITALNFSIFTDWEIGNILQNSVSWIEEGAIGYVQEMAPDNDFAGVSLLTANDPIFYAIDQDDQNGNVADIGNIFSEADKSTLTTGGIAKTTAGLNGGNNVAQINGAELGALEAGASKKVAFAFIQGNDSEELLSVRSSASDAYTEFILNPPLFKNDSSCVSAPYILTFSDGEDYDVYSDPLGQNLLFTGDQFEAGLIEKDTSFYVQKLGEIIKDEIMEVFVRSTDIAPNFGFSVDTLFLGDSESNIVNFQDSTVASIEWVWDFGNNTGSTSKAPTAVFNEPGDYTVVLNVKNKFGCTRQASKVLRVRERGPVPEFSELMVCKGDSLAISSTANNQVKVYLNPEDDFSVFSGQVFKTGKINSDTTFYISNIDPEIESQKVAVEVTVIEVEPGFRYQPDTLDLNNKNLIQLLDETIDGTLYSWRLNTIEFSNEKNPIIEVTESANLSIQLVIENSTGCKDSVTQILNFEQPAPPIISDTTVCTGDTLLIKPEAASHYYYYSDSDLTNLIHKGHEFLTGPFQNDTLFYVTNVDGIVESERKRISIFFEPFEAQFSMSPNPIILEDNNQLKLRDNTDGAISWQWFIDDQLVEIVRNPILTIDSAKSYSVKLVVENTAGCLSDDSQQLEVLEVVGIEDLASAGIKIYPNPTDDILNIQFTDALSEYQNVSLWDMRGLNIIEEIASSGKISLDLSDIKSGSYIIRFRSETKSLESIIIKR